MNHFVLLLTALLAKTSFSQEKLGDSQILGCPRGTISTPALDDLKAELPTTPLSQYLFFCLSCPRGYFGAKLETTNTDKTAIDIKPPQTSCTSCPLGYYTATKGQTECTKATCPKRFHQSGTST